MNDINDQLAGSVAESAGFDADDVADRVAGRRRRRRVVMAGVGGLVLLAGVVLASVLTGGEDAADVEAVDDPPPAVLLPAVENPVGADGLAGGMSDLHVETLDDYGFAECSSLEPAESVPQEVAEARRDLFFAMVADGLADLPYMGGSAPTSQAGVPFLNLRARYEPTLQWLADRAGPDDLCINYQPEFGLRNRPPALASIELELSSGGGVVRVIPNCDDKGEWVEAFIRRNGSQAEIGVAVGRGLQDVNSDCPEPPLFEFDLAPNEAPVVATEPGTIDFADAAAAGGSVGFSFDPVNAAGATVGDDLIFQSSDDPTLQFQVSDVFSEAPVAGAVGEVATDQWPITGAGSIVVPENVPAGTYFARFVAEPELNGTLRVISVSTEDDSALDPSPAVQVWSTGDLSEIWTWAGMDELTTVNLFVNSPGPSLCDAWAAGERVVQLALPDSLAPEPCDGGGDANEDAPVQISLGERRVVVYRSDDLPVSITLLEIATLLRGEAVDRLGDVNLIMPPEEEWAYDVVVDAAGTPASEMNLTAWRVRQWSAAADLEAALAEPLTLVVTSDVFAGFDDRAVCVGVDDPAECRTPSDGWPVYPLSRPLTITADGVDTLELLWPVVRTLDSTPEPQAVGYVLDLPAASAALDAESRRRGSTEELYFVDTGVLFVRQIDGETVLCASGGDSDPIACDELYTVAGLDLVDVDGVVVEEAGMSWYSPTIRGTIEGRVFNVVAYGPGATPGSSERSMQCNAGATSDVSDRAMYEEFVAVSGDVPILWGGVTGGVLELTVALLDTASTDAFCGLGYETTITSVIARLRVDDGASDAGASSWPSEGWRVPDLDGDGQRDFVDLGGQVLLARGASVAPLLDPDGSIVSVPVDGDEVFTCDRIGETLVRLSDAAVDGDLARQLSPLSIDLGAGQWTSSTAFFVRDWPLPARGGGCERLGRSPSEVEEFQVEVLVLIDPPPTGWILPDMNGDGIQERAASGDGRVFLSRGEAFRPLFDSAAEAVMLPLEGNSVFGCDGETVVQSDTVTGPFLGVSVVHRALVLTEAGAEWVPVFGEISQRPGDGCVEYASG